MRVRLVIAVVGLLFLVACSGGGGVTTESAGTDAGGAQGAPEQSAGDDSARGLAVGDAAADGDTAESAATGGEADAPAPDPLPDTAPVVTGDRIIKEGTVSLEIEEGNFDRAFSRVIEAARRFGGDVVASSTRTNDDGATFGTVTVRVPVADFEDLIVGIGEIGTIRHRDIGSQDVTAEFTDLESRLRHLRAQERFYLGLLDEATGVQDAIAVQQQLEQIQAQIETAQGRLNVLDDRTTFSTLTVELFEPGLGSAIVADDDPANRPTLARYWDTARDAFVNVVGSLLVAVLFLLPLLALLALPVAGWLALRRRGTKNGPGPQPEPTRSDDHTDEPVGSAN